ncbi:hypothetical protein OB69_04885 [Roseivirga seohaensis subsp. aquiponti]|uniref:VCBS repeat-containing protein n=1 Tax=Roseivirga seohaensis subsp. aquiponti TaxID=1566026 RepID=A0A0L8AN89_9BACT|nr:hypothetical protein [Roseivirga seohaensis]KOF03637.1 hypothetical protein OB69_04885 [Roseivirga seohaensis subsp. aquiponti]
MKLLKYKISILFILGCSPIPLLAQDFVWDTTYMVSGNRLEFNEEHYSPTHSFLKFSKNGNVIFLDSMDYTGPSGGREFVDFNQDGYIDLKITWISQVAYSRLYLYDPESHNFRFVDDLKPYLLSSIFESDKSYYYSYSRAGCADNYWISHLFRIDNFKTVRVATIYGEGCSENDKDWQIRIVKYLPDNSSTEIDTLPYSIIDTYKDNKWGFIEDYWNRNVNKFKN